jgi:methionyl-tRNA formyltransferase
MRTAFLGSSAFAVEVLKALLDSPHRPALVVTPPDRPKGRGRRLASPPAAEAARELGVELLQTASVNGEDELAAIARQEPDVICVCEFGQLIKEPLLSRYLILNVHPSLLPRWRGAAPIERALMAGDTETGVTIFKIEEGLDSGPIALGAPEPVLPDDTAGTLSARLAPLGGRLLVEALDRAQAGELELVEQGDEGATYAQKIQAEERQLDPARPAVELERVVRALTPHIGAYLALPGDERLGVCAAKAEAGISPGGSEPGDLAPGELRVADRRLLLGCSEGVLVLTEVQPPGKRPMPAGDYLRGHTLPPGV